MIEEDVLEYLCIDNAILVIIHAGINDQCVEFNKGTALHIAAEGLCKSAAESLIALGADASLKDERQLLPWQCVPSDVTPEQQETADQLREFLRNAAGKREKKKVRHGEILTRI